MQWSKCLLKKKVLLTFTIIQQFISIVCRNISDALHPVLVFAQFFGIIPVLSIKSSSRKFNLLSILLKNIYTFAVQCSFCVMLLILFYIPFKIRRKFTYDEFVIFMCYFNCFLIAIAIFKFSYKLPTLFREWIYFDYYVTHVNDVDNGKFKALNSVHILIIFMIMTLIEDILSYATDYESSSRCFHLYESSFEGFTRGIIPSFFKVFTYSHYWGAFFIITRFYRSIIWSFSNVFLVVIYYVIYNKVQKFNEKIIAMEYLVSRNAKIFSLNKHGRIYLNYLWRFNWIWVKDYHTFYGREF